MLNLIHLQIPELRHSDTALAAYMLWSNIRTCLSSVFTVNIVERIQDHTLVMSINFSNFLFGKVSHSVRKLKKDLAIPESIR